MITRRSFLKNSLALGGASYFAASSIGSASEAFAQCVPGPSAPTVLVRPDVNTLATNHPILEAYRTAIRIMRSLSSSDVHSWNYQTRIHQDFCPHGNWFFLPWHRAYLLHFEQIIRRVSGYSQFVLPYWDWTRNPRVPVAFWGPNNPLYQPRTITPTGTIPAEFVGSTVVERILSIADFQQFASFRSTAQRGTAARYGSLEGTPHNGVHRTIGGVMANMSASLDPIFWLHHANIDRLWTRWMARGGRNPTESAFTNYVFTRNFPNVNRQLVNVSVCSTLSTYPLGYRYADQAPPSTTATARALVTTEETDRIARANGSGNLRVVGDQEVASIIADAPTNVEEAKKRRPAKALVRGIKPREKRSILRAFLNHPGLSPNTPIDDPHYLGSFALFGHEHGELSMSRQNQHNEHMVRESEAGEFVLDLNVTLANLKRGNRLTSKKLDVRFVAVPIEGDPSRGEVLGGNVRYAVLE